MASSRRIILLGAGGREFHNFNMLFRDDPRVRVVAFTAAQIPFQENRCYPPSLAGVLYPDGIPIVAESELGRLVAEEAVDEVILAYSDLPHGAVMETASRVLALGADFRMAGPRATMLKAALPVVSVCAVRTGCGKSPVTRYLCRKLQGMQRRPVVVRHPMAYGGLALRAAQLFRDYGDLESFDCTLEEREEFEPLIRMGVPVLAGVDYRQVLSEAEAQGDVLIWDGGNNDFPFIRPDLEIVLADPWRAGDETAYYPGMVNLLRASAVLLAKTRDVPPEDIATVRRNVARCNPGAHLIEGDLLLQVDDAATIEGKRVAVVEDGPTLTHGGMSFGAGVVAARRFGAAEIVDPRPYAVGSLTETFRNYPHLRQVVPAMGYSPQQREDLGRTLEAIPCDLVLSATPVDLGRLVALSKPLAQVSYEFTESSGDELLRMVRRLLGSERVPS